MDALDSQAGRAYWRSLDELADTPEFQTFLHREFPAQASEFTDPRGRRDFLRLMGASIALAGATACTRQPAESIIPYVRQPEELVPGRPLFYATAMPMGGYGMPLLAESHEGRPTKTEGNPEHPASLGATDVYGQAAILDLYDPDRSRTVLNRGDVSTWSAFITAFRNQLNAQAATQGGGFRLLTEPISSPSLLAQIQKLLATFPSARWHQWDPVYGVVQTSGGTIDSTVPTYRLEQADVIVSLDADFLGFGPAAVRAQKDFARRRKVDHPGQDMNRLYVVEPTLTVTGSRADHRMPIRARDVHAFAAALAGAMGAGGGAVPGEVNDELRTKWIPAIAKDLQAHRGRCAVIAGDKQPPAVHALARAMNQALGNTGATVTYAAPAVGTNLDGAASLRELTADMAAGRVEVLLMLGGNPVFTAPADLDFTANLRKVGLRAHLCDAANETSAECHWHVNEAHFLESWGDIRSFDGSVTVIQPLIAPLYGGKTALELIASLNGEGDKQGLDLVREQWTSAGLLTGETPDKAWRRVLHDGFAAGSSSMPALPPAGALTREMGGLAGVAAGIATGNATALPSAPVATPPAAGSTAPAATPPPATETQPAQPAQPAQPPMSGLEIVFRPDPTVLDGRFANNGWLQELPKPITKITWDAAAYISARTAERLGLQSRDLVDLRYKGRSQQMPIWVQPGHADESVTVHFGYGRPMAGRVGSNVGFNAFTLRTADAPWFDGGLEIAKTGETYAISTTQTHHSMEGRHPVRVVTKEGYAAHPESVHAMGHSPADDMTLYPKFEYNGHKWGMTIDTNTCSGCQVCIIACQSENNIAIVGKEMVGRGREMQWLRVDTYHAGSIDNPETYHQPVPCMQCENAPCEQVCPVAATTHSAEGLNDMTYNRCVGTRYCSNNCPYKVRRFNFLLYTDYTTASFDLARNPDVTVRSRGIMEKCTYCVQRINHARVDAKTEGRGIMDGEVKTACEQACPSDAIVFGDLNDPNSRVSKLKAQERNYGILEDLNTRPRTTYLAAVRNPNPEIEPAAAETSQPAGGHAPAPVRH
ncbi:MAG: TAT-variant-translocated molybdopterin oxidoreductase [Acidobacteriota bacterium]|nr:TAT-variant-translocated molybdopterin oxidoreductase [Acidobacteriota bacterium]